MSLKPKKKAEDKTVPVNTDPTTKDNGSSTLNSPMLDEATGKPTRKAVESASQAYAIAKAIFDRAKQGRIKTAAVISAKYNGEPPFSERDLEETAQSWRNNFSTNFLASIIDRVKPQILDPVQNADLLTRSSLPKSIEDAATKSRTFGECITRTIRTWPGWGDFCSMLAQENVCFGNAIPAWLDKDEWRPKMFRQDESFMPEGTGQHASKVQIAGFTQSMLLNDFLELFQDKKAAEVAGYNFPKCVEAANNASGSQTKEITPMTGQDAERENGLLFNVYANTQSRTVELFHLLVREYDGGVDLWTVTQISGLEIRHVERIYESMEDAVTLFTLQTGNTRFYGSKGLGRLLTNLHIALERGRCLAKDQEYLSGLTILSAEQKLFNQFAPAVKHPFVLVDKEFKVAENNISWDAQKWDLMDNKLVQLAESIAGAFIPPNIDTNGGPNTKIEAAQRAERDQAVRKGVLGRFIQQFYDLTGTIQRKICSKENLKEAVRIYKEKQAKKKEGLQVVAQKVWDLLEGIMDNLKEIFAPQKETKIADPEAVNCLIEMLENGLNVEEIAMLALSPAAPTEEIDSDGGDANTLQFIAANAQNPFLDKAQAFQMAGEIMIGKDRMTQLFVPQDDPTVLAREGREQMIEISMMGDGQAMPVAATDNHPIHRQVILQKFAPVMQLLATQPTAHFAGAADLVIQHFMAHLAMDSETPPEAKKQEAQQIGEWAKVNAKAKAELQKQAQSGQNPNLPAPVQGQPIQAGADGRLVGDPGDRDKLNLETGKAAADITLKTHAQLLQQQAHELESRKLALQERDQAHRHQMEVMKFQHGVGVDVTKLGQAQDAADLAASQAAAAQSGDVPDSSLSGE